MLGPVVLLTSLSGATALVSPLQRGHELVIPVRYEGDHWDIGSTVAVPIPTSFPLSGESQCQRMPSMVGLLALSG